MLDTWMTKNRLALSYKHLPRSIAFKALGQIRIEELKCSALRVYNSYLPRATLNALLQCKTLRPSIKI